MGANTISVASGSTLDFVTFGSLVPSHGLWAMTRSRTAARKNAGDNAVHNANRARFELLGQSFHKAHAAVHERDGGCGEGLRTMDPGRNFNPGKIIAK